VRNVGWIYIGGAPPTATTFTWTVPATPTTGSYIFLGNVVNGTWEVTDSSDASFTIASGIDCSRSPGNPGDNLPDDGEVQSYIDNCSTVVLGSGYPGYLIASGLHIRRGGITLRSADPLARARLVAAPGLFAPILEAVGTASAPLSAIVVSNLEIDGNVANRSRRGECSGYRSFGYNVRFRMVDDFTFSNNVVTGAMCGTAFEVSGRRFRIENNQFLSNGRDAVSAPGVSEPWADGITLLRCEDGVVQNNDVVDATDIGIVGFGGRNCRIAGNRVRNDGRRAFAGIGVAVNQIDPDAGQGDHAGSVVRDNDVSAAAGKLAFGISIGMHPWNPGPYTTGGDVRYNRVSGAFVNLAVDGASSVSVLQNEFLGAQGSGGCGSATPANYTVNPDHAPQSQLQAGWIARSYDSCIP
jgi:parallel beta-helix repeat protein